MSENRLKIGVFLGRGSIWPKISDTCTMGHPLPTILLVGKLRLSIIHTV